jgi:uncharacterized protein (TIGR02246 family)
MKRRVELRMVVMVLCLGMLLIVDNNPLSAQDSTPENATAAEVPAEEQQIRANITAYLEVFNAGKAEELGKFWTANAEVVLPSGDSWKGQNQLVAEYKTFFTNNPGAKVELSDIVIQLLSPNVALETGNAVTTVPDQTPRHTTYEAVHVKSGDGWLIDRLAEQESEPAASTREAQLQPLTFLLGTWAANDGDGLIEMSCRWTTRRNFLVQSYKIVRNAEIEFESSQIIGWDPRTESLRSWMFDSEGGFGVGRWSESQGSWTLHTLQVLNDGREASGTYAFDLLESDRLRFRSLGREVEGELVPNLEPVELQRTDEK